KRVRNAEKYQGQGASGSLTADELDASTTLALAGSKMKYSPAPVTAQFDTPHLSLFKPWRVAPGEPQSCPRSGAALTPKP
ncbi:MAG: hypothetical protein WA714_12925, partial [Candidatus Acidiferrales bacterium]